MICPDCNEQKRQHLQSWFEEILFRSPRLPFHGLERMLNRIFDRGMEWLFRLAGVAHWQEHFPLTALQLRSACFVEEMGGRGLTVRILESPFGLTNHFACVVNGHTIRFDGLPFSGTTNESTGNLDDKEAAKRLLRRGNFPVADSATFWWWQRSEAMRYVRQMIGFPVVVKPRNGYLCHHVYTDIRDAVALRSALARVIAYTPSFVVERHTPGTTFRATVVGQQHVACVEYVPAHVVGDGTRTVRQLVEQKNADPRRGVPPSKRHALYRIVMDEDTETRLRQQGVTWTTIPPRGQRVWLHARSFQRLGGDIREVSTVMHPENAELFLSVARFVGCDLLGLDVVLEDITRPWHEQSCAILELSTLPSIELHHFPSEGTPQPVGRWLAELMVERYRG